LEIITYQPVQDVAANGDQLNQLSWQGQFKIAVCALNLCVENIRPAAECNTASGVCSPELIRLHPRNPR
jgi:hypothetical protein